MIVAVQRFEGCESQVTGPCPKVTRVPIQLQSAVDLADEPLGVARVRGSPLNTIVKSLVRGRKRVAQPEAGISGREKGIQEIERSIPLAVNPCVELSKRTGVSTAECIRRCETEADASSLPPSCRRRRQGFGCRRAGGSRAPPA